MTNKVAFTLAEVLITLGIIGVVAAMTIPTLVARHQDKVTVNRVKKFNSTFSQAYLMAVQENGTLDNWGLAKTVNFTNEDGERETTEETIEVKNKFFDILEPYLKNIERNKQGRYIDDSNNKPLYIMPDGTGIVGVHLTPDSCNPQNKNSYCGDIYYSTNLSKPRHIPGTTKNNKQIFSFVLRPNSITPYGSIDSDFDLCKSGEDNSRCSAWVILNGNVDYLYCPDKLGWNKAKSCK